MNVEKIKPRHLYHINNLDLLHRSKEESQIDVLQRKAKSDEMVMNSWEDDESFGGYEDDQISDQNDDIDVNEAMDDVIACPALADEMKHSIEMLKLQMMESAK